MAWPITASTATTLAVFMPLLFWPDITGEFMKYMPITLLVTLSASLMMALIAVPTLGSLNRTNSGLMPSSPAQAAAVVSDLSEVKQLAGLTGRYLHVLALALRYPARTAWVTLLLLLAILGVYSQFGHGVEFFPDTENDTAIISIRARGDLSLIERDQLVRQVEERVLPMAEVRTLYTSINTGPGGRGQPQDLIGSLQLELQPWHQRRHQQDILNAIRQRTTDLPGIIIEAQKRQDGPSQGRDIQLSLVSSDLNALNAAVDHVMSQLGQYATLTDLQDTRPLPGIEWQITVDRTEAARYGADIALTGNMIQLLTHGLKLGEFRAPDSDEEIEIRLRYPENYRYLDQIHHIRVRTTAGTVPISHFVTLRPQPKTGNVTRSNSLYAMKVEANLTDDRPADTVIAQIAQEILPKLPPGVAFKFEGDQEQQQDSANFLMKAFGAALFIMAIIIVTQFNSFYQAGLILSAIVFSTIGVLLTLMLLGEPFGIVMCGVGVISLAGIVVNNNIVLIDTYNLLRRQGNTPETAALITGAQRLRPILLTTITTVLGLIPMMLELNIDLLNRQISLGAPSAMWWSQLATTIASGLAFATPLTLILTPCLLIIGDQRKIRRMIHSPLSTAPA
jgi:multidrug efflux pump